MKFGANFIPDPPPSRIVELAKRAEDAGFDYVWIGDSHIIWQEPWPIFALMAKATSRIKIGPLVTNPGTRDWTVLASLVATLNDLSGGRFVCGIGRGDSARRTIGMKPVKVAELEAAIHVVRDLAEGREVNYHGTRVRIPWAQQRKVEIWGAGYGPRVLELVGRICDGFVLQLADPDVLKWVLQYVRKGAVTADRKPNDVQIQVAAPPYLSEDMEHAYAQLRYFAASVGNHVVDLLKNYGGSDIPAVLTDFVQNRPAYDYLEKTKLDNPRTDYVPDEITERFCVMGGVGDHIAKLKELEALGTDLFTGYFTRGDIEGTLDTYGSKIIPAFR